MLRGRAVNLYLLGILARLADINNTIIGLRNLNIRRPSVGLHPDRIKYTLIFKGNLLPVQSSVNRRLFIVHREVQALIHGNDKRILHLAGIETAAWRKLDVCLIAEEVSVFFLLED